jgi:hypothetical protein
MQHLLLLSRQDFVQDLRQRRRRRKFKFLPQRMPRTRIRRVTAHKASATEGACTRLCGFCDPPREALAAQDVCAGRLLRGERVGEGLEANRAVCVVEHWVEGEKRRSNPVLVREDIGVGLVDGQVFRMKDTLFPL